MAYADVEEPIPFVPAFASLNDPAVESQAACLLLLGHQLEDGAAGRDARAVARGEQPAGERAPPEDVRRLEVPPIVSTGERYREAEVLASLAGRWELPLFGRLPADAAELYHELARQVAEERTSAALARLLEACLRHPDDLVCMAAAIAYAPLAAEPLRLFEMLAEGLGYEDELVRELAATGLARFAPEDPRLAALTAPGEPRGEGPPTRTSLLIHGTFARRKPWWQPGGNFHTYLRGDVQPDLYSAADRFEWSGGYSDRARALGAEDLVAWVARRDLAGLDLFCHSHGGNVAMLASQAGLTIGRLVLLSCPVRRRYQPDFDRVSRVISVRVRLDLVILADGGGQRFRDERIEENVLPLWFRHSATHSPRVWRRRNIPDLL